MNTDCGLVNAPNFFRLAKNVSKISIHKKQKIGAVLVVNGHPLSVGCNQLKTHQNAPYTGLHAEVQAMKSCGRKFIKGASIYVYRKRKDGKIGVAKPCKHCMKALKDFGVRWVYYSVDEYPFWEVEKI